MAGSSKMRRSRLSSPPCFLDESESTSAWGHSPDDSQRWRTAQRDRLITERLGVGLAVRNLYGRQITERLNRLLPNLADRTVSGYWPFKGEPDLRPWLASLGLRCARAALPVIAAKNEALRFRLWRAGDPLERGMWNIPQPAEGEEIHPHIIVVPLVGFDRAGYRLGYGGGYFDRTLAVAPNRPRIIGVGYGQSVLKTIYPQPHDVPMDVIVTESETLEFERP
jgi:5-formyltetrahydrofolate cyclo-ligase